MDRRALDVKFTPLRIGSDEAIEITRFEFMRVLRERFKVANAIVAGACFENVAKRKRAKGRIATRAAAANRQPVPIGFAGSDEITGGVDAIVDIDDAPAAVEAFSVCTAIA